MINAAILRPLQAATYLGVSRATLYRWASTGYLPSPIRIGPQSSGWLREDLDRWLLARAGECDRRSAAAPE